MFTKCPRRAPGTSSRASTLAHVALKGVLAWVHLRHAAQLRGLVARGAGKMRRSVVPPVRHASRYGQHFYARGLRSWRRTTRPAVLPSNDVGTLLNRGSSVGVGIRSHFARRPACAACRRQNPWLACYICTPPMSRVTSRSLTTLP